MRAFSSFSGRGNEARGNVKSFDLDFSDDDDDDAFLNEPVADDSPIPSPVSKTSNTLGATSLSKAKEDRHFEPLNESLASLDSPVRSGSSYQPSPVSSKKAPPPPPPQAQASPMLTGSAQAPAPAPASSASCRPASTNLHAAPAPAATTSRTALNSAYVSAAPAVSAIASNAEVMARAAARDAIPGSACTQRLPSSAAAAPAAVTYASARTALPEPTTARVTSAAAAPAPAPSWYQNPSTRSPRASKEKEEPESPPDAEKAVLRAEVRDLRDELADLRGRFKANAAAQAARGSQGQTQQLAQEPAQQPMPQPFLPSPPGSWGMAPGWGHLPPWAGMGCAPSQSGYALPQAMALSASFVLPAGSIGDASAYPEARVVGVLTGVP